MIDKRILWYLSNYYNKYPFEDLKKKIISSGYSEDDIEDALIALGLKKEVNVQNYLPEGKKKLKPLKKLIEEKPKKIPKPKISIKEKLDSVKKLGSGKPLNKSLIKKSSLKVPWMKIGGISGIVLMFSIVMMLIFSLTSLSQKFVLIFAVLALISNFVFYFGYFKLSKEKDFKLLKYSSLGIIILDFLMVLLILIGFVFVWSVFNSLVYTGFTGMAIDQIDQSYNSGSENLEMGLGDQLSGDLGPWGFMIGILILIFVLIFIVLNTFFGIGLIKFKDEIKLAKISGILHLGMILFYIIGIIAWLIMNLIGVEIPYLVSMIVAGIMGILGFLVILFESLTLLNASNLFEKKSENF